MEDSSDEEEVFYQTELVQLFYEEDEVCILFYFWIENFGKGLQNSNFSLANILDLQHELFELFFGS